MSGAGAHSFRASPTAYDAHVGRYGAGLAQGLIQLAGVRSDDRVLDVGCGTGLLTAALASVVGEDRVGAVDPSEGFVEACRRRVPGADVRLAVAEDLPFADASFDCALSQLVVNFMTDPEAGVQEMRRVTRPDGVVAACVWDYADEMTMLRTFWDAAVSLDPAAAPLDEGVSMHHCQPESLQSLWESAGLRDIRQPRAATLRALLELRGAVDAPPLGCRALGGLHRVAGRTGSGRPPSRDASAPGQPGGAVRPHRPGVGGRRAPLTDAWTTAPAGPETNWHARTPREGVETTQKQRCCR